MSASDERPRVALTLPEAADSLGISLAHFRRHVLPELKVIRIKTTVRISVHELERWAEASGTLVGGKSHR